MYLAAIGSMESSIVVVTVCLSTQYQTMTIDFRIERDKKGEAQ